MGIKFSYFTKVNRIIFTTLPFNIDDEMIRDNKIFGIKAQPKKSSIKNKSKKNDTKKNKFILRST